MWRWMAMRSLHGCCLVGFNPCWLRISRLRDMIWNLEFPPGLINQGSPESFKSFQGMTNVNCHYGPPGNKGILPFGIGRKPFRLGEPCTDCNSGHGWCDNGLCIECPDKNCDCPIKVKFCLWFVNYDSLMNDFIVFELWHFGYWKLQVQLSARLGWNRLSTALRQSWPKMWRWYWGHICWSLSSLWRLMLFQYLWY